MVISFFFSQEKSSVTYIVCHVQNQVIAFAENQYQAKYHDSLVYLHTVDYVPARFRESPGHLITGTIREEMLSFNYHTWAAFYPGGGGGF